MALSSRNALLRSKVGIFGIDKVGRGSTGDQTLFVGHNRLSVELIPGRGQTHSELPSSPLHRHQSRWRRACRALAAGIRYRMLSRKEEGPFA